MFSMRGTVIKSPKHTFTTDYMVLFFLGWEGVKEDDCISLGLTASMGFATNGISKMLTVSNVVYNLS